MNGHPIREEDFDLYALGTLEGDEKREFQTHVASCSDCARKLAEARGRIALLALAAPPVIPSAIVKARLMKQVRQERSSLGATSTRPSAPREAERAEGFFGNWWAGILVPTMIVLAIISGVLWTENQKLDRQLASLRADVQQQQLQLQEAREVADLVTARDTMLVPLAAQPGMPKGAAHVMYNEKMGMLMYEGELEPAPANKSYQLWLVPAKGSPISAGVFTPGADKSSHFMMKLPEGVKPAAFAVTLEPSGGKPQPTGPKVLVGAVS
jgi:anti-sigma-K factor RskA